MTTIYDNGNSDNNEYMNIRLTQKNAYLYFNYPTATSIVLIDPREKILIADNNMYMVALHFASTDTLKEIFNTINNNKINSFGVNACMKYSIFNLPCVCDYCIHNRDYMNTHVYGSVNTLLLYNVEYYDLQVIQHINYKQSKNIIYEKYNNKIMHMYFNDGNTATSNNEQPATTATVAADNNESDV